MDTLGLAFRVEGCIERLARYDNVPPRVYSTLDTALITLLGATDGMGDGAYSKIESGVCLIESALDDAEKKEA